MRDEWFKTGSEPTGYCPIHTSAPQPEPQWGEAPQPTQNVPQAIEQAGKSVGKRLGKALKKIFKW